MARGKSSVANDAGGGRQVDRDLRGLPQVQDDGVRRVRPWVEIIGVDGKTLGHAPQVSLEGGGALRQEVAIERAHPESFSRRASYSARMTGAMSSQ